MFLVPSVDAYSISCFELTVNGFLITFSVSNLFQNSFICNLVGPGEFGKVMSTLGASYTLALVIGSGIYNPIYTATLTSWDGFIFAFVAGLIAISFLLILYIHVDSVIMNRRKSMPKNHDLGSVNTDADNSPLID